MARKRASVFTVVFIRGFAIVIFVSTGNNSEEKIKDINVEDKGLYNKSDKSSDRK